MVTSSDTFGNNSVPVRLTGADAGTDTGVNDVTPAPVFRPETLTDRTRVAVNGITSLDAEALAAGSKVTITKVEMQALETELYKRGSVVASAILALARLVPEQTALREKIAPRPGTSALLHRPDAKAVSRLQTLDKAIGDIEKYLAAREERLKASSLLTPRPVLKRPERVTTVIRGGQQGDLPEYDEEALFEECIARELAHEIALRQHLAKYTKSPLHTFAKTIYSADGSLQGTLQSVGMYTAREPRFATFAKLKAEGFEVQDSAAPVAARVDVGAIAAKVKAEAGKLTGAEAAAWQELLGATATVHGFTFHASEAGGLTIEPPQGLRVDGRGAAVITVDPGKLGLALSVFSLYKAQSAPAGGAAMFYKRLEKARA